MKKNCVICDAEFEGHHNKNYCGKECKKIGWAKYSKEYARKIRKIDPSAWKGSKRKCVICNDTFSILVHSAKYCGEECRKMGCKKKNRKKEKIIKKCVVCDTEFGTHKPRQVCCGSTCSKERHKIKRKEYKRSKRLSPITIKKNCVICNNEFEGKGRGMNKRNTCGDECKRLNINQRNRISRISSPERIASIKLQKKKYMERPEVKERMRKKRHENREEYNRKHLEYVKHKRATDPEFDSRMREASRVYANKRLKTDVQYALNQRISCVVRATLKAKRITKRNRTYNLLGYTGEELKEHLESYFTEESGYSWDNMGDWHIDHIRPIASFNYTTTECEDFKKCWALNNLQPLWALDNIRKRDKWDGIVNA